MSSRRAWVRAVFQSDPIGSDPIRSYTIWFSRDQAIFTWVRADWMRPPSPEASHLIPAQAAGSSAPLPSHFRPALAFDWCRPVPPSCAELPISVGQGLRLLHPRIAFVAMGTFSEREPLRQLMAAPPDQVRHWQQSTAPSPP